MTTRYIVYGAGAIGGVIGARMFQSGHEVVLIARGAHFEAIRDRGLRIQSPDDDVTLAIPVVDNPSQLDLTADDVIFLAMKSQDTIGACDALASVHRATSRSPASRTASRTSGWSSGTSPAPTPYVS